MCQVILDLAKLHKVKFYNHVMAAHQMKFQLISLDTASLRFAIPVYCQNAMDPDLWNREVKLTYMAG